ncbi:MAG TPA: 3-oxoacyl-[acyl-carrier-protein] synthase III C-terminal domain-containing protein [Stellaceae bacterium]|nr:3-oxoacyl-[acyl-carrier-protein] synthase III C-terminal domain-containing protein [Stellaceae bacterium]
MTAPRLLALATAVPPHALRQSEVRRQASALFLDAEPALERLLPVFDHSGIETRYSCVPLDWYRRPAGWKERNRLYVENALALLEEAARRCLGQAGLAAAAVDALVVVSTTGIATPSLDAHLVNRLGLRPEVQRLPIFGLGCAGGVLGLARAAALARAAPASRVLFLVVELCMLCFRKDDLSKSNIVATALFGDGAAGAILACAGDGPRLGPAGEHTWPQSLDIMGWEVEEDGLKALFSRDIPALVRSRLRAAADAFLARHGLSRDAIGAFVCHPGGAKVLSALEEAFELAPGSLVEARRVLRDYGNMSAVTVLFVLERMLRNGVRRRMLMSALGPGFTAGFMVLDNR